MNSYSSCDEKTHSPVDISAMSTVSEHPKYDWEVSDTLTQFCIVSFGTNTTILLSELECSQ